jgi:hypothetical protein
MVRKLVICRSEFNLPPHLQDIELREPSLVADAAGGAGSRASSLFYSFSFPGSAWKRFTDKAPGPWKKELEFKQVPVSTTS